MRELSVEVLKAWIHANGWMFVNVDLRGRLQVDVDPVRPKFNVKTSLVFLGDAIICDSSRVEGRDLVFGPNAYLAHHAEIGGGSCFEDTSSFRCGRNFHLGSYSIVNTAYPVTIGDNVGIGRCSLIATHGAYLDVTQGFPEQWGPVIIGNNVWLPSVIVMPNVTIGDNTVVAAGSIVTRNIEGGGLWMGAPARRVEGVKYPNPWGKERIEAYIAQFNGDRNLLRRHGIRDLPNGWYERVMDTL